MHWLLFACIATLGLVRLLLLRLDLAQTLALLTYYKELRAENRSSGVADYEDGRRQQRPNINATMPKYQPSFLSVSANISATTTSSETKDNTVDRNGSAMFLDQIPVRPLHSGLQGEVMMELSGQLGNHLSILAYYFVVKKIAQEDFNFDLKLHVRKQNARQSISAAKDARCFMAFRDLDFDECESYKSKKGKKCKARIKMQRSVLIDLGADAGDLRLVGSTSDEIRQTLRRYVSMLQNDTIINRFAEAGVGWDKKSPRPFLYTDGRTDASLDLIDEFYDRGLPDYFAFDEGNERCCGAVPSAKETVFHYRAFDKDLRKKHRQWGGAELIPSRAAIDLMGHLPNGSAVALVGRSHNDKYNAYKEAFEGRSLRVRSIVGQSGIQDFCFLAHAKAGLIGTDRSTYAKWATIFNKDLRNATLYVLNYDSKEKKYPGHVHRNMHLSKTVHHSCFNVSEEDVW